MSSLLYYLIFTKNKENTNKINTDPCGSCQVLYIGKRYIKEATAQLSEESDNVSTINNATVNRVMRSGL